MCCNKFTEIFEEYQNKYNNGKYTYILINWPGYLFHLEIAFILIRNIYLKFFVFGYNIKFISVCMCIERYMRTDYFRSLIVVCALYISLYERIKIIITKIQ